jgi:lysophospholipase L1-like esterase
LSQTRDKANLPAAASERGVKQVRQLLLGLFAITVAALVVGIVLVLKKPRYVYFAPQVDADLTYLLVWIGVAVIGILTALRRKWIFISYGAVLLLAAEAGSQLYSYKTTGAFARVAPPLYFKRFEPHPLLVGIPREGNYAGIVHDAQHRRRTWNEGKRADPKYIFVFGGSTTYDIANEDLATWPSDLSRLLGKDYVVENYGVPGYTSLENMIQSLFAFRETRPVCAIYFEGINDLRSSHIRNLRVDYSDFQLPGQRTSLAVMPPPGLLTNYSAFIRLLVSLIPGTGGEGIPIEGDVSDQTDPRLAAIYMENMRLIAAIDRHFGVKAIFVANMADYADLKSGKFSARMPFVRDKDIEVLLPALGRDLAQAATDSGAIYLTGPLAQDWAPVDFVDNAHFSVQGAQKFAQAIAGDIAAQCQ